MGNRGRRRRPDPGERSRRRRGIGGGGAKGDRGEPLGALGSRRDGRRRRVGEARRSPVNCVGRNGALVQNSRREIARQVHEGEAELVDGLG